jgi:hypothetical protein
VQQQPQPFEIETRDEFKRVHTSRTTIARCMGTRWLLAKNAAQCWRKSKRYGGDRDGIELTIGAGADPGG